MDSQKNLSNEKLLDSQNNPNHMSTQNLDDELESQFDLMSVYNIIW